MIITTLFWITKVTLLYEYHDLEPQLLWLQTAIYHTDLDVKNELPSARRISTNTMLHQLCWGDWEWHITYQVHIKLTTGLKDAS